MSKEAKRNLMDLHRRLIRIGEYQVAKKILLLLRKGSILLGLCDTDWQVQCLLEDMGIPVITTSRNGGWARARIA